MRGYLLVVCQVAALAQVPTAPVVNPRGVINGFTQQPAPSTVAPGGIIWINGLNLGPPRGVTASGVPWPTSLGDPAIQVMINGRAAPIGSATPDRVVAQVPYETAQGVAQVVVRRGEQQSRPARIFVNMPAPSIRTLGDKGYGQAAGTRSDASLTISASGLGETEPRVSTGDAGPTDTPATPRREVRAFVGGIPANVDAWLSPSRVGEFDVKIEIPAEAQPGDVVTLFAGNVAAMNPVTYSQAGAYDMKYVPLPDGTPELHGLVSSSLRGWFLLASGERDDQGCYQSYTVDAARGRLAPVDGCLTAGNRNAQSPAVTTNDGNSIAAFAGPPQGDQQTGVSSTVSIFSPGQDAPVMAQLPAAATNLIGANNGDFVAVVPGTPPRRFNIDSATGEVTELQAPGAGGAGGGAGVLGLQIDLGSGLVYLLSNPVTVAQGVLAVVVGDDPDHPAKAKLALVNARSEVQATRDFPDGWVPLVAPLPAAAPGGGGGPGGGGIGGAIAGLLRGARVAVTFDQPSRTLFVVSRKTDDSAHGVIAFGQDDSKALPFPDKWFPTGCTATIPVYNLELSRRVAFLASNTVDLQFKTPCSAQAFMVLDLAQQTLTVVPVPEQGQVNIALGVAGFPNPVDLNDYVYGADADRQGRANSLFVLDGVTLSAFRIGLRTGLQAFAQVRPIPALNLVEAVGLSRVPGEGGVVLFDLDNANIRFFPVPQGFASITVLDSFVSTRKLVARGIKPDNSGSQYLIYDLNTEDLTIVPNPDGVAFVGDIPRQAPTPGQGGGQPGLPTLERPNLRSNTVEAVCYSSDRKQVGIMVLRIP